MQSVDSAQKSRHWCGCRNFHSGASDAPQEALSHCGVKHCLEPLAWNSEFSSPVAQTNCPLFTKIRKELRDLIFEYALTESSNSRSAWPGGLVAVTTMRCLQGDRGSLKPDRPENLPLTCWAIYRETYLLPILLNPVRFSHPGWSRLSEPRVRLPWQFANIQAVDVTLSQVLSRAITCITSSSAQLAGIPKRGTMACTSPHTPA